jgi:hypothetical protein
MCNFWTQAASHKYSVLCKSVPDGDEEKISDFDSEPTWLVVQHFITYNKHEIF